MDFTRPKKKNKRKMPLATVKGFRKGMPKDLVENNTVKQ
jgi:hypothetical protein